MELQLKQASTGQISGAEALGTRMQSLSEKLARRTTDLSSGQIGGENGVPLPPRAITRADGIPSDIVMTATSVIDGDRKVSSLEISWAPIAGGGLVEVWTLTDGQDWALSAVTSANNVTIPGPPSGHVSARIRTAGKDGTKGPWSGTATVNVETGHRTVPAPTVPSLSSRLGAVYVGWDGTAVTADGQAGPVDGFDRLEISTGPEPGTIVDAVTSAPGVGIFTGPIGEALQVWARIVDANENTSQWADCGTIRINGVEAPDIEAGAVMANAINAGSVLSALGTFVRANVGQISGDAAVFVSAVVDHLTANRAVLDTLWSDIIRGRYIEASQIVGGVVTAQELHVGGVKINPQCLAGQGPITNPIDNTRVNTDRLDAGGQELARGRINLAGSGSFRLNGGEGWLAHLSCNNLDTHSFTLGTGIVQLNMRSGGADANVHYDGGALYWASSKRDVKHAIRPAPNLEEQAKRLLDAAEIVDFYDRAAIEERKAYARGERDTKPPLRRILGLIAEDVEAAGLSYLTEYVGTSTGDSVLNGVAYSKIGLLLLPLVRELYARIEKLENPQK